jgi:hypothetical protein
MSWKDRDVDCGAGVQWKKRAATTQAGHQRACKKTPSASPDASAVAVGPCELNWRDRVLEFPHAASSSSSVAHEDRVHEFAHEGSSSSSVGQQSPPEGAEIECIKKLSRIVDLDLTQVELIGGGRKRVPKESLSEHAKNGIDKSRIVNLKRNGACTCKQQCGAKLAVESIFTLCTVFWQLTHQDQQYMLHTLYTMLDDAPGAQHVESPGAVGFASWKDRGGGEDMWDLSLGDSSAVERQVRRRTQWTLCGQQVCVEAFYRVLGIGRHRLLRIMHGSLDLRRTYEGHAAKVGKREVRQAALVDRFFAELYVSAAEPAPNEFRVAKDVSGGAEKCQSDVDLGTGYAAFDKQVHDLLPTFMKDVGVAGVPTRFLQYSRVHDLFWLFLATCNVWGVEDGKNPSWTTFWRVWDSRWRRYLGFRSKNEHAQCTFCWKCHEFLGKARPMAEKYEVAKRLREHLQMQYKDRAIYWAFRWSSRLRPPTILCLIVDSMDKSKLAMPRWKFGRVPKLLDGLVRPVVTLTAGIAHGFATCFLLSDENVPHGPSALLEAVVRCLDHVLAICKRRNLKFPDHLVIQSDNPTNQAKNSVTCMMLAYLTSEHRFLSCTLNFLVVGHTHEDVDQVFALVCEVLLRASGFQDPEELAHHLYQGLRDKVAERGETLIIERMHYVRDFRPWLAPLGAELYNAFGTRSKWDDSTTTLHSFAFKCRRDLFPDETHLLSLGRSKDWSSNPLDVFVLAKKYMHSTSLEQPPLLCLARQYVSAMHGDQPTNIMPRLTIDDDRRKELQKMIGIFDTEKHGSFNLYLPKAAKYYREHLAGRTEATKPSAFLACHRSSTQTLGKSDNIEFPHLPGTAWELKVRWKDF